MRHFVKQVRRRLFQASLVVLLLGSAEHHSQALCDEPTLRLKLMPGRLSDLTVKTDMGVMKIHQINFIATGLTSVTFQLLSIEDGQVTELAKATEAISSKGEGNLYVAYMFSSQGDRMTHKFLGCGVVSDSTEFSEAEEFEVEEPAQRTGSFAYVAQETNLDPAKRSFVLGCCSQDREPEKAEDRKARTLDEVLQEAIEKSCWQSHEEKELVEYSKNNRGARFVIAVVSGSAE